jgi:hypothetical protein
MPSLASLASQTSSIPREISRPTRPSRPVRSAISGMLVPVPMHTSSTHSWLQAEATDGFAPFSGRRRATQEGGDAVGPIVHAGASIIVGTRLLLVVNHGLCPAERWWPSCSMARIVPPGVVSRRIPQRTDGTLPHRFNLLLNCRLGVDSRSPWDRPSPGPPLDVPTVCRRNGRPVG